jgi:hypothetical protein
MGTFTAGIIVYPYQDANAYLFDRFICSICKLDVFSENIVDAIIGLRKPKNEAKDTGEELTTKSLT